MGDPAGLRDIGAPTLSRVICLKMDLLLIVGIKRLIILITGFVTTTIILQKTIVWVTYKFQCFQWLIGEEFYYIYAEISKGI